jgi:hypothetical protein
MDRRVAQSVYPAGIESGGPCSEGHSRTLSYWKQYVDWSTTRLKYALFKGGIKRRPTRAKRFRSAQILNSRPPIGADWPTEAAVAAAAAAGRRIDTNHSLNRNQTWSTMCNVTSIDQQRMCMVKANKLLVGPSNVYTLPLRFHWLDPNGPLLVLWLLFYCASHPKCRPLTARVK